MELTKTVQEPVEVLTKWRDLDWNLFKSTIGYLYRKHIKHDDGVRVCITDKGIDYVIRTEIKKAMETVGELKAKLKEVNCVHTEDDKAELERLGLSDKDLLM